MRAVPHNGRQHGVRPNVLPAVLWPAVSLPSFVGAKLFRPPSIVAPAYLLGGVMNSTTRIVPKPGRSQR